AKVWLDDVYIGRIDLYSPVLEHQRVIKKTGLAQGPHTLAIEVSGKKNRKSTNTYIDIDAFEVVP
ncbi:MAG: hypothetical protein HY880_02295, partial [Deltaproteobacteria bacterium]|nr:hypothetical protein [Deltaproteobacteria bacterium]